jgi:nucleotide-binding universal stress UspA family protein
MRVAFLFSAVFSNEEGSPNMSKEEILNAIKKLAEELGRAPSLPELRDKTGISPRQVRRAFLNYSCALKACGLEKGGAGYTTPMNALFKDWAELTRKLGRVPKLAEYEMYARYSAKPLLTRFGIWGEVPAGLLFVAEEQGWGEGWEDVLEVARAHLRAAGKVVRRSRTPKGTPNAPKILKDRPTYGPPLVRAPLAHGPTNEQGVLFLFGAIAEELGFLVTHVQTGFPDVEAMREVAPGVWQRVDIEVEEYSRNFVAHMHDPNKCDLIVCWEDNWPESPLEVIELKTEFERLQREGWRKKDDRKEEK